MLPAVARAVYTSTSATLTRAEIENGIAAAETYSVSAIDVVDPGNGYDLYSVATLYAGGYREDLTLTLGDAGDITEISGFNSSTAWPTPPRVTITRWTAEGTFVVG